jgi:hypothetical protein
MFRGQFTHYAAPAISVRLSLPDLATIVYDAEFLLDTGAAFSVLHPKDAEGLRLDVRRLFATSTTVGGRGIGGRADYVEVNARLELTHTDGRMIAYLMPLRIAAPTADNADYPSFLGMDFIGHFKLCVALETGTVELE